MVRNAPSNPKLPAMSARSLLLLSILVLATARGELPRFDQHLPPVRTTLRDVANSRLHERSPIASSDGRPSRRNPHGRNYVYRMPVAAPDPAVDSKMPIKAPDAATDYKLHVVSPTTPR
jgi:hypothetical protein